MGYDPKDAFYRKARQSDLRARSAFKIDEILQRFRLVRPGNVVLDLGAAPGGFLRVLEQALGPEGQVVGLDLVPIKPLGPTVVTWVRDVNDPALLADLRAVLRRPPDLVASDMAPKTSGIRDADEARSLQLVERALELALGLGKPGADFVAKVFMGSGFEAYFARVKAAYEHARVVRPEATRTHSREVYVLGERLRAAAIPPKNS